MESRPDGENFQKNRVRFESVLIQLGGVGASGGINPLSDFFISTRSQTSHWARLFIYVIEKVAHLVHLLNAPILPNGRLPEEMEVA